MRFEDSPLKTDGSSPRKPHMNITIKSKEVPKQSPRHSELDVSLPHSSLIIGSDSLNSH